MSIRPHNALDQSAAPIDLPFRTDAEGRSIASNCSQDGPMPSFRYRVDRITKDGRRQKFGWRPCLITALMLESEQKAIDRIPPRERGVRYEIVKVRK